MLRVTGFLLCLSYTEKRKYENIRRRFNLHVFGWIEAHTLDERVHTLKTGQNTLKQSIYHFSLFLHTGRSFSLNFKDKTAEVKKHNELPEKTNEFLFEEPEHGAFNKRQSSQQQQFIAEWLNRAAKRCAARGTEILRHKFEIRSSITLKNGFFDQKLWNLSDRVENDSVPRRAAGHFHQI